MPYYQCRIVGEDGRVALRSVLAPSAGECRKAIEAEGVLVLSVRRDLAKLGGQGLRLGRKVKDRDIILFNQELVALIKAGYPILKSLEVISTRAKNIFLRQILIKVADEVKRGKALSEAFLPYEELFSPVYTASLMAGEKGGNLPGSIGRYIQYAKVVTQTRAKIKSAMTYPTILIVFSFILMGILVNFVLPQFNDFYKSFEAEMPRITRILMSFATATSRRWYVIVAAFAVLALLLAKLRRRPDFRYLMDRVKLRVPFGRAIWLESGLSLFSRTLGLLLEAGISLISAIGIAIQAVPNAWLVQHMKDVPDHIRNGESLSESLAKAGTFPALALDMVRIGESSANLQGMLGDMADFYDERVRGKIETLVNLVEPVVIIFMGLVVAAMLLSVYIPIFNIIRIAQ
ncbi:MAG: type II secretion system F family protein [Candidatus Aminicenantes bacterium]|nr:type II secretion system F family protein [Candidatus Aminicenantes bacterium]MCJ7485311.1 type II secretion system F family protein [Candidatus Aminicenantes bacterium]